MSEDTDRDYTERLTATVARTIELTGLSKAGIYRLHHSKQIKLVKIGRSTLVDWASVRGFLATRPVAEPAIIPA